MRKPTQLIESDHRETCALTKPHNDYWKNRTGRDYALQQQHRRRRGNTTYERQEQWLTRHLVTRHASVGRPLRLLDFGCGFGRIARLAAGLGGIEYTGYDFSASMAEPLTSGAVATDGLATQRNVYIGDDPIGLLGEARFDIVLTISVLIHNDESEARELLSTMSSLLADGGQLILVENALVSGTRRTSSWHAGCWMHDICAYSEGLYDVAVYPEAVPQQCIYQLTRTNAGHSVFTVIEGNGQQRVVSRDEIVSRHGITAVADVPHDASPGLLGLCHDAMELREAEHDRAERLVLLLKKARERYREQSRRLTEAAALRHAQAEEITSLTARLSRIRAQMNTACRVRELLQAKEPTRDSGRGTEARNVAHHPDGEPAYVFDPSRDTQWAQPAHPAFDAVLLVYNQQWVGIRAAVGCFPGTKLALSTQADLGVDQIKDIAAEVHVRGIRKVLVHGFSEPMTRSLPALKAALDGIPFYGVWHGSFAAWAFDHERDLAAKYLTLADMGVFRRIHLMRTGAHVVHSRAWPHLLPNVPPRVPIQRRRKAFARPPFTALFPSWNNTWKNLYANLYAAAASNAISRILTYSAVNLPHFDGRAALTQIPYGSRAAHFDTLATVDLCLNATIVDCHPMVELEALAVDTPTLRSSLDLDFDSGHPYPALMTVDSPHDASAMARRIQRIASTPPDELAAILSDYRDLVTRTSFERYGAFLDS